MKSERKRVVIEIDFNGYKEALDLIQRIVYTDLMNEKKQIKSGSTKIMISNETIYQKNINFIYENQRFERINGTMCEILPSRMNLKKEKNGN